jgi:hypothetical protein
VEPNSHVDRSSDLPKRERAIHRRFRNTPRGRFLVGRRKDGVQESERRSDAVRAALVSQSLSSQPQECRRMKEAGRVEQGENRQDRTNGEGGTKRVMDTRVGGPAQLEVLKGAKSS